MEPEFNFFREAKRLGHQLGWTVRVDFNGLDFATNDDARNNVGGLAPGAFLLAVHQEDEEALLLRALHPLALPDTEALRATLIRQYQADQQDPRRGIDPFTRREMSFSGFHCRILGSFHRAPTLQFRGDTDNLSRPELYAVMKPRGRLLEYIVNLGSGDIEGAQRVGRVRYTSSEMRLEEDVAESTFRISAEDFLGKRSALFGMTRTGKSNTVKTVIMAVDELARRRPTIQMNGRNRTVASVGQLVFDINGEYSNPNQQDAGAIFAHPALAGRIDRYSTEAGLADFQPLAFDFHASAQLALGLSYIQNMMAGAPGQYVRDFLSVELDDQVPEDPSARTRYLRHVACYRAILAAAGMAPVAEQQRVRFHTNGTIAAWGAEHHVPVLAQPGDAHGLLDIPVDEAGAWFIALWEHYGDIWPARRRGDGTQPNSWSDANLDALMTLLSSKLANGTPVRGLLQLRNTKVWKFHSPGAQSFLERIPRDLERGRVVLLDLSRGEPWMLARIVPQLAEAVFLRAMDTFRGDAEELRFVQMYVEEAHNYLPTRPDPDDIFSRIAKEGQKYDIGLAYSTQEPSLISSNIRANTQNWFITHLNNRDEIRNLVPYYDLADFEDSIRRSPDTGFARVKTASSPFTVPVQIDRFAIPGGDGALRR